MYCDTQEARTVQEAVMSPGHFMCVRAMMFVAVCWRGRKMAIRKTRAFPETEQLLEQRLSRVSAKLEVR